MSDREGYLQRRDQLLMQDEEIAELKAELAALREAAQEKINADIDCWAANNLHEHAISNKRNELAHDKLAALLQEKGNE